MQIVELLLDDVSRLVHAQNMKLSVTKGAKDFIATVGFDPEYGARPLKRAIQNRLETPLSEKIIKGEKQDVLLQREDQIIISSIFDLREEYYTQVEGEVGIPGKYPFIENMTVEDIVVMAGGFLESASLSKVEVARRVKISEGIKSFGQIAEVIQFSINKDLSISDTASNFILLPFFRDNTSFLILLVPVFPQSTFSIPPIESMISLGKDVSYSPLVIL